MVNEAILGALRSALARNESLKKAMMTVYNAGYKKEEISEAARLINEGGSIIQEQQVKRIDVKQPQQPATTKTLAPSKELSPKPQQPTQPQKLQQPTQQPPKDGNVIQKVSGYGQPPTKKSKTIIIVLGFLLLFLIGSLVTLFLFKEELLDFFNNLFS